MSQITLVSDQHDDNVGIGVIPQLLQPPVDILVGLVFADIVDEKGTNGTTVVSRGDGTVTFLTSSIPDLSLDRLGIHLDRAGCELDTDSRLGVQVEFVPGESAQQVGLSDTRVTNKHHYSHYHQVRFRAHLANVNEVGEARGAGGGLGGVARNVPLKRNCFTSARSANTTAAKHQPKQSQELTSYSSLAMRGSRGSDPAQKGVKGQRIDVASSRHEKGKLAVVGDGTGQRSQQPGKERKRKHQR